MLDMLNEDSRAAIGKVKQLQQQGMPADQIDAQMSEAARNGLLPLSVAFAAQKMLQRTQQAANPVQPPQGTVVNDMIQQIAAHRNQGVAGLANPIMDNAQFAGGGVVAFADGGDPSKPRRRRAMQPNRGGKGLPVRPPKPPGGIAGLAKAVAGDIGLDAAGKILPENIGRVAAAEAAPTLLGRAAGFLGGPWGIAAGIGIPLAYSLFKGEDKPEEEKPAAPAAPSAPVDISQYFGNKQPSEADQIASLQGSGMPSMGAYDAELKRQMDYYRGEADPSKLGDEDKYISERIAREKAYGIGASEEKRRQRNEARRRELEDEYKKGKSEDIAMGFLDEGVQAGLAGQGTVASLVAGLVGGKKKAQARTKDYDNARDKLDQMDDQLDAEHETRLANNITGGVADYKERKAEIRQARTQLDNLAMDAIKMRISQEGAALGRDLQLKLAEISARAKGTPVQRRTEELVSAFIEAGKKHDEPAKKELAAQLEELTQLTSPQYQTEGLKQDAKYALLRSMMGNQQGGGEAASSDGWSNFSVG